MTSILAASAVVLIVVCMIVQYLRSPRCPNCSGRLIVQDIGLDTRMTQCRKCGEGKIEQIP